MASFGTFSAGCFGHSLLPVQSSPHMPTHPRVVVPGVVKSFDRLIGVHEGCKNVVGDFNRLVIHWLGPEARNCRRGTIYEPKDCPPGSDLDKELLREWPSLFVPNQDAWRKTRWNRHGDRQSWFDQETFFRNACSLSRYYNLTNIMHEVRQESASKIEDGFSWGEDAAEDLLSENTLRLGKKPKLTFDEDLVCLVVCRLRNLKWRGQGGAQKRGHQERCEGE
ncbi:hypothetical protein DM860_006332 [Cuscuta australis]|uniref:Uncharacterized protein n=1 Tax=Cuscuta australis TaxID=267555 RepID=A0A328D363_9ASTE|nr:hypothetical protein DM860_006332 [Cuscuta australis]